MDRVSVKQAACSPFKNFMEIIWAGGLFSLFVEP
jgi:hypothetical protein